MIRHLKFLMFCCLISGVSFDNLSAQVTERRFFDPLELSRPSAAEIFKTPLLRDMAKTISARNTDKLSELSMAYPDADLNGQGKYGLTLLYWALIEDNVEAYEFLLNRGASPDAKVTATMFYKERRKTREFFEGDTVLISSLRWFKSKYCAKAIPFSKKVDHRDIVGQSLLHIVISRVMYSDYREAVSAMLKAGLDPNEPNKYRREVVPVRYACSFQEYGVTRILLEHGAHVRVEDDYDIAESVERYAKNNPKLLKRDDFRQLVEWLQKNDRKLDLPEVDEQDDRKPESAASEDSRSEKNSGKGSD